LFQKTRNNRGWQLLAIILLLAGLQQLGSAGYIKAKAELAQGLIQMAWQKSLASGGEPVKPWPWADTWPVARLKVAAVGVDLYVLAGATGNALAFGPGYETASARPGSPGLSLIGGHRDTHFAFLPRLQAGTAFELHLASGERLNYRVSGNYIADIRRDRPPGGSGDFNELLLVTCYPFDSLRTGGPLRYVISAQHQPGAGLLARAINRQFSPGAYEL
jgi:sortase A